MTLADNTEILLVDDEDYSSALLVEELELRGYRSVGRIRCEAGWLTQFSNVSPAVVIFNFHYQNADSLEYCRTVRSMWPDAAIVAIVSPGPAIKLVRQFASAHGCIDVIVEKPLSDDRFYFILGDLIKTRRAARAIEARAQRMESLLPEAALAAISRPHEGESEMFEAVVVFTDIRRSTSIINRTSPQQFFFLLNQSLSAQSAHIHQHRGAVIKYTGDGLLAVFRGMGKSHLAMRAATALAASSIQKTLPFGIGVAEGLVMAGLVGDSHRAGLRRQYDVIGATVHLASRLCSLAKAGEVIAMRRLHNAARGIAAESRPLGSLSITGFDEHIDCVAFNPLNTPHVSGE